MSFLEWLGLRGGAGLEHVAASTIRDVAKQTGKEALKEVSKGGLQEDFNYWAEKAGTKAGFNLGDFWDRVVQGMVDGGTAHGVYQTSVGGVKLARRAHGGKTPSAPAPAPGISDIVAAATETKLLSRNPQSFQNTVDAMAGDAGVSHVTMDRDGVAKALSQPDIDAPSIMKKMPSLAPQLVRSLLHGDPIRIPFGEYVTALAAANDNVKGALLEHVTGEPTVPLAAEGRVSTGTADRQNATSTDRLLDDRQRQGDLSPVDAALLKSGRAQDQAVEANQPDPEKSSVVTEPSAAETFKPGQVSVAPGQDPLQAIRDTATEVLKANGLRTKVAEATAAIVAVRAEDRARRLGMDPVDLYNEKPLQKLERYEDHIDPIEPTFHQPINADVELNQPVRVIKVNKASWSEDGPSARKKSAYKSARDSVAGIVRNLSTGWDLSIPKDKFEHGLSSYFKSARDAGGDTAALDHIDAGLALRDIAKHAILVDTHEDFKGNERVRQVHDMFSAIQVDDALYSVKLIVKEYDDGHRHVSFKDIRRVHDYYLAKKVAAPSGETGPGAASSARDTLPTTSPSPAGQL